MKEDRVARAFLGVERSLGGWRWQGPDEAGLRRAEALVQRTGLPGPLCAVLARQGVAAEAVEAFLAPRLRDELPDPLRLRDMGAAAERLVAAAQAGERVAVFADYDVDGAASAALLLTWLRDFGIAATLYVPDRIDEGYGPNAAAMAGLARDHDLILCVDCGTLSHEPLAAAAGADVVVVDHHLAGETLPPALAVVNPNRQDEPGDLGHLCAAGVVFLLLVEANRRLRAQGRAGPELMAMLDLVALATVADVAQLVGVNRAFVRQGLQVMARRARAGLAALADAARMDRAPAPYHLGYVLGPRVNAGGRIGQADLGARLLATDDAAEAARIAAILEGLNAERRGIEAAVREAALAQAEARGLEAPLVWAAGEGWHPGVVGIVAARLKEAARRPAVVIAIEGGIGKGSARSVAGVDLGAAVQRLAAEGWLIKGGGHRMAAGLTVEAGRIAGAMARLAELVARQGGAVEAADALRLDGLLAPSAVSLELVEALDRAGPYGQGAPAPRFALAGLRLERVMPVGTGHLRLRLTGEAGPPLDAIAFGARDGALGAGLVAAEGRLVHVAGRIEANDWQGSTRVQLQIDDAAPA